MVVSGPKQFCGNRNGPVGCDWSDVWWSDFKKRIEHEVLEGGLRAEALKRMDQRLDPAKPLEDEAEMAQRWAELQSSSLTLSAYEGELFNQWQRIGCAVDGAPYVLTSLTQTLQLWLSPFKADSLQPARLAAEFLKEDCAGARGLSEDGWRLAQSEARKASSMANDISAAATAIGPIVETVSGKLRGSLDNGIHIFKGVPYGASLSRPRGRPIARARCPHSARNGRSSGRGSASRNTRPATAPTTTCPTCQLRN
jgi:hypothetical protein